MKPTNDATRVNLTLYVADGSYLCLVAALLRVAVVLLARTGVIPGGRYPIEDPAGECHAFMETIDR